MISLFLGWDLESDMSFDMKFNALFYIVSQLVSFEVKSRPTYKFA